MIEGEHVHNGYTSLHSTNVTWKLSNKIPIIKQHWVQYLGLVHCRWAPLMEGLSLMNVPAFFWYVHRDWPSDQTQNSEVNVTLLGREKEGHCQLSFANYQVKAAVAGAPFRKWRLELSQPFIGLEPGPGWPSLAWLLAFWNLLHVIRQVLMIEKSDTPGYMKAHPPIHFCSLPQWKKLKRNKSRADGQIHRETIRGLAWHIT